MSATILYVEDNPENRQLVRRILQAEGFTVLEAHSAASAQDVLARQRPDLILMDINMPDIDGYTFTRQLKADQKYAATPIVAITANVMKGDRERTLASGCDGYIMKPIDIDLLPQQIQQFLSRPRQTPAQ